MTVDVNSQAAAQAVPCAIGPADLEAIDALPLPYVEIDSCGIITRANRRSIELVPAEFGELLGKMAWDLVASDEKDPSFAAYCSSLEKGEAAVVARRSLCGRSGQFRSYDIFRSLMRDREGNPSGMRLVCVDVTDATRDLNDAHRKAQWLESVIDSISAAVLVTDAVGIIQSANPAAEALLGLKTSELMGRALEDGLPIRAYRSGQQTELQFTLVLESATKGIATAVDQHGRNLKLEIGTSPIFDKETGATAGAVLVLREIAGPA